jgi:Na+/melibiose symporter-like transporter
MLASVIPLAVSFIAVFTPPAGVLDSQASLFWWLLASVLLLRTALTFFMVPYLALGAEISSDYHERTRLSSARVNLGWFVGVLVPASSLALLFTPSGDTDGRFVADNYVHYGMLSAFGVIIASLICINGTKAYIPKLTGARASGSKGMWRDIVTTFRNRNFRLVVLLETVIGGMGGIISTLLMVYYTYFWLLDTKDISAMLAGPPLMAVLIVTTSSSFINQRLEKQQLLKVSCILGGLNLLWLTPLKLFEVLPQEQWLVLLLIYLNYVIHITFVIIRSVSALSLLADIADEQDLATGQRQEGVMFAVAFFASKFVSGFGYLVAGPFLDAIGLQTGMQPGETPDSVIWGLGLMMGPGLGIMLILPAWWASRIRLNKESHRQIQQSLRARDAAASAEG